MANVEDYRGVLVMGSYHYLEIITDGDAWVLVAEMEAEEALAVPNQLMYTSLIIMAVVAAAVAFIASRVILKTLS